METRTLQEQFLIVSDPPHGQLDVRSAAPCIGLSPAQVRLKANYPLPEIWVADRSRIRVAATAQTLRLAGHKLAVVRGRQLLLPPQTLVELFSFAKSGLVVSVSGGSEVEIPYDAPITGVVCKPRCLTEGDGSHDGNGLARTIEPLSIARGGHTRDDTAPSLPMEPVAGQDPAHQPAFLDLYVPTSTGLIRVTFSAGRTDFTGLGSAATDRATDNLNALVAECENHLVNLRLDLRLEDMLPRRPVSTHTSAGYSISRTGYSFASERLPRLLDGIAPGLAGLSQCELASRLAYLTAIQRDPAPRRAA